MDNIIKQFFKFFFRGLLFTGPIFITFYIIIASLQWIDHLIPIDIPGLGLLIIIASITLLGLLASTFLAKPILEFLENLLGHIPLVSTIYSSIKDVVSAFVGDSKKFKNPVFITLEKDLNVKRIGFITEPDLSKIGKTDMIAVYVPDSYGLTGNLYVVPKDHVEVINMPVSEVMKFVVSGGIAGIRGESKEANEVKEPHSPSPFPEGEKGF